jgi:Tol biopolymer transport system component
LSGSKRLAVAACLCALASAGWAVGFAVPARATVPGLNGVIAGIGPTADLTLLNPIDGSQTRLLKSGYEEESPAWSPTGDRIAVLEGTKLITLNPDGTGRVTVLDNGCVLGAFSWSPDGTKIAYHTCDDISIVNTDGTGLVHVPNTSSFGLAEWSPDGQWLVGAHYVGDYDIWKIRPDGSDLTQLTDLPGDQFNPTLSPDGTEIAFEDRETTNWEIATVSIDGGAVTNITQASGKDFEPSWSPDGTKILFGSTRSHGGLFTLAPDGTDLQEIPNSRGFGSAVWQPAQVQVSSNKQIVPAGSSVRLDLRIAASGTTNPSVTLQRRTSSTSWADWRTVEVDSSGAGSLTPVVNENVWFRAIWAGDATHLGATSIQIRVQARVTVSGHLFRNYGVRSGWRLYHFGKYIWYTSDIVPNHAGKKMCFEGQRIKNGHWRGIFFDCYKIRKDGTTTIYVYNVPLGERLRIRAVFRGDADHVGDSAPWDRALVTR